MRSAVVVEQYQFEREQIQKRLAIFLKNKMTSLIDDMETADLLLVAADGKKMAVHKCILRARAPGFFQRHIEPTIKAIAKDKQLKNNDDIMEVAIGDIDSYGLEFFVKSVYTEEEISRFPPTEEDILILKEKKSDNNHDKDDDSKNNECPNLKFPNDSLENSPLAKDKKIIDKTIDDFDQIKKENSSATLTSSTPSVTSKTSKTDFNDTQYTPLMTSFKQLGASQQNLDIMSSSMITSGYSEYSMMEQSSNLMTESYDEGQNKFNRMNDSETSENLILNGGMSTSVTESNSQTSPYKGKGIFNMFIGLGGEAKSEFSSGSNISSVHNVRNKTMMSRRLSVTSLNSLNSLDLTPVGENSLTPQYDQKTACKLAQDLLQMYLNQEDTDVILKTANGELYAHKCILSITCNFFKRALKKSKIIELKVFSKSSVNFLLTFLYGGLTTIPEEVDIFELISLATHLDVPELGNVVSLHFKAYKCHYFHRPCSICVSAIFDALPQFAEIKCLNSLYEEAMDWQARHFGRIWKGRVFLYLNERYQRECLEYLIQKIDQECVIDVLLSCEKLQISLPRSKLPQAAEIVKLLVNEVIEYCIEFIGTSFDLLLESQNFINHGKGLALNLNLLEDLFPSLIHSLSSETAVRSFKVLGKLLNEIENQPKIEDKGLIKSLPLNEFNPRFINLCRRLYELIDKHLLHYAASVIKSDAYNLLSEEEQNRIQESGIFIEMREPKAAPPRLSSFDKTYRRSSSVGTALENTIDTIHSRKSSVKDKKPLSEHVIEESMDEREREKSMLLLMTKIKKEKEVSQEESNVDEKKKSTPLSTPEKKSSSQKSLNASPNDRKSRSISKTKISKGITDQKSFNLDREATQVIMTVNQNKAVGIKNSGDAGIPAASLKEITPKPQGAVKPMVKDVPLAKTIQDPQIKNLKDYSKQSTTISRRIKGNDSNIIGAKNATKIGSHETPTSKALSQPTKRSLATKITSGTGLKKKIRDEEGLTKVPTIIGDSRTLPTRETRRILTKKTNLSIKN
uniref:BTB domain-containing protein n=1 Tax=Strongyloides venezuelensis TaxID=75913 RepID=A0A0K0FVA1_STRVS